MKKIVLVIALAMVSCGPMSPEQRQAWLDFDLKARGVLNATASVANVAGAYANVQNSRSIRRISKNSKRRARSHRSPRERTPVRTYRSRRR